MPKQFIFACLFTGVYDVNRSETLANNDYSLIEKWVSSITSLKLHGIIFHNSFSADTVAKYSSEFITFKQVEYNPIYNLSVYRYFVYLDYLLKNPIEIESLFVTDSTDVEVVNNPFEQPLFKGNSTSLFCGDEPSTLNNEWMMKHSTHFRNQIPTFAAYEQKFANETLLNCGIIGGSIEVMTDLLTELVNFHTLYNQNNKAAYTGDMGAFNYIARNKFNNQLFHGAPINTIFKGYETNNNSCWFRHK
jgi:hypothetical protein